MTAAIYYHPEAYTTAGPKLMGRNAAGESFLRGFLAHSRATEFSAQVQKPEHGQHFAQTVQAYGRSEAVKVVDKHSLAALAQAGVVYYPGPGIGEHAWQRAAFGTGAWSLCGITHTTSSAAAMDALSDLITAPVQPWDAVICTSTAVKNNVERVLQAQVDYLKDRLGITKLVLPQLPVIPLGIHTQDFAFTEAQKAVARQALGVDEHTLVVLFMGRLSFHAKAHPLAMYQALEAAAQATGKNVVLVECGWHANEPIARAYADAARLACPSVRVVRSTGARRKTGRPPGPARMDPFHAFASYPTQLLTEQTVLGLVDGDADTAVKRILAYRQLAMIDFAKVILPTEAEIRAVLQAAATGPKTAVALIATIPTERQAFVFRSLAWLAKLGVLKVCA
jgi:hypothetical protein